MNVSIPLLIPHCLDYCVCIVSFKSSSVIPPPLFYFSQIVFSILVPLPFHKIFRISLFISKKNLPGTFMGNASNLQINLLSLPIHKQSGPISLFRYSFIFFISILKFQHIDPVYVLLVLYLNILFFLE